MEVDAAGLCAIIRACHKTNVSRLKFGDVDVTFGQDSIVSHETALFGPTVLTNQEPLGSGPVSMELAADQKAIMEDAAESELMITNPEAWEQHNVDRIVHQNRSMDG